MTAARRLFDIEPGAPGVTQAAQGNDPAYSYRFKTLSFGMVSIDNANVMLARDTAQRGADQTAQTGSRLTGGAASAAPPLVLGVDLLRLLHIYIAFNERMFYATQGLELAAGDAKALPVVTVTPQRP